MLYEQPLKSTTPRRVGLMFRAFNRWLEEDWGFDHQDRIFAAPYLSLADVNAGPSKNSSGRSTRAPGSS